MKLNRKWMLLVALVLSVAMATTGTLAYLTDEDADVNTRTLGKVEIVQNESQRVVNEDGTYKTDTIDGQTSYVLEEFEQDKPLLPIVGDPHKTDGITLGWDDTPVRMTQIGSYGSMQVFAGKNAVDKFVTVTNTGKSDAFVRTFVAIEIGSTDGSMIRTSYHGAWDSKEIGVITIDGNNYMVTEYSYPGAQLSDGTWRHEKGILPAGDTTYPSLAQVYLGSEADNEDVEAIDGNGNGKLDILVLSQAVQADGFEVLGAEVALNAGFGEPTATDAETGKTNIALWFGGLDADDIGSPGDKNKDNDPPYPPVSTADELVAALEAGKDVKLMNNIKIDPASMSNAYGTTGINVKNGQSIDGNGYTIDIKGAGGTWDSGINTTGGLIKNLTVTGSFRGIFINHNSDHSEPVVLKNVTIDGTTYTISCDQGMNQTFEATDSIFKGWTSYAATLGSAKFVNCEFGEGNGYAFCRPYASTEFVGCKFEAGYRVDPVAAVTFENCTIGGEPLTAENLAELVTKPANATVK